MLPGRWTGASGSGVYSKYRAVPTEVDGVRFASKKEAKRYQELKLLERAGKIRDLKLQPRYVITLNDIKICTYVGDFQYREGDVLVLEDVKGVKTDTYRIKKKLVLAVYNLEIREV